MANPFETRFNAYGQVGQGIGGVIQALAQLAQKKKQQEDDAKLQALYPIFSTIPAQTKSVASNVPMPSLPQFGEDRLSQAQNALPLSAIPSAGFAQMPQQTTVQTSPATQQFNLQNLIRQITEGANNPNSQQRIAQMFKIADFAKSFTPQTEQRDPYKDTYETSPITGQQRLVTPAVGKMPAPTNKETIPTGKTRTEGNMVLREVTDRDPITLQPVGQPRWEPWQQVSASNQPINFNLSPQEKQLAEKIAKYEVDPSKVFSLRGNRREQMMSYIAMNYPEYDQSQYTVKAGIRKDFTSGKAAGNIRSLNTAIGHLNSLKEAADGLQNGNVQILNRLANAYKTQTGQSAPTVFNSVKTAVAGELATTFKGTGGTDQEIKQLVETINSAQSPKQVNDVVASYIDLIESRLTALDEQYKNAMGGPSDFKVLNQKSQEIINKVKAQRGAVTEKDIDNMSVEELKKFLEGK